MGAFQLLFATTLAAFRADSTVATAESLPGIWPLAPIPRMIVRADTVDCITLIKYERFRRLPGQAKYTCLAQFNFLGIAVYETHGWHPCRRVFVVMKVNTDSSRISLHRVRLKMVKCYPTRLPNYRLDPDLGKSVFDEDH